MRVFPIKRVAVGQDAQPDDYINPELQQLFTVGNTLIDAKNIPVDELVESNFVHKAWQKAQHIAFDSLSSITVANAAPDYDTFGMSSAFTVDHACILTGSISLPYTINTVNEKNWVLTGTQLIAAYNEAEYKFIIHHKFGIFIDGIKVAETDNIGTGIASCVHLPFYAPISPGTHTIEVKVKLPQGSVLSSSTQFVPGAYGYAMLYSRYR